MKRLSQIFAMALVALHGVLLFWGLAGLLEYLLTEVPWRSLQNPSFPKGVQFLHWLAITGGGGVFLMGYATKWRHTTLAMTVVYTMMATLCAVETLDLMTNPGRYLAMAAEYIAYLGILAYMYRSSYMRARFGRG